MRINGIDAVRYGAEDLERCRKFWTDFGLIAGEGAPGEALYRTLDGSEVSVRAITDSALPPASCEGSNIRTLVWGVPSVDDLEAVDAELGKDRKVQRTSDDELLTVDDCGFSIGFRVTRRKQLEPASPLVNVPNRPARINTRVDFSSPVSVRQIGHVALYVRDYRAADSFYGQRLGFRLSDSFKGRGVFLRAPGSNCHHNLFALTREGVNGLHHISFEVDDFQTIIRGGKRMGSQGWETQIGPGRHAIGSNYFWYFLNPCGGAAEYYSDMDYLTDDWQSKEWEFSQEVFAPWSATTVSK
jgi:catechol 2,3-dioxygenase-like lactoylglutathione lyase family enzyme